MSCATPSSGGYDSDVERDKRRDYTIKTYANPIRDGIGGTKPHLQEAKPASGEKKPTVSRNIATTPIVACSQTTVGVKASVCMHRDCSHSWDVTRFQVKLCVARPALYTQG